MDFLSLAAFNISSGIRDLEAQNDQNAKGGIVGKTKEISQCGNHGGGGGVLGFRQTCVYKKNGTDEITPFCKPWRKKIKEATTVVVFLSQAAGLQLDFQQECS